MGLKLIDISSIWTKSFNISVPPIWLKFMWSSIHNANCGLWPCWVTQFSSYVGSLYTIFQLHSKNVLKLKHMVKHWGSTLERCLYLRSVSQFTDHLIIISSFMCSACLTLMRPHLWFMCNIHNSLSLCSLFWTSPGLWGLLFPGL